MTNIIILPADGVCHQRRLSAKLRGLLINFSGCSRSEDWSPSDIPVHCDKQGGNRDSNDEHADFAAEKFRVPRGYENRRCEQGDRD